MPGFACFYRIFLRVLYRKKMYPTALKMWDTVYPVQGYKIRFENARKFEKKIIDFDKKT